jgi:hypothetical protein
MSATDDLLVANQEYARTFERGELPMPPDRHRPSSPLWTPASCPPARSGSRRATAP